MQDDGSATIRGMTIEPYANATRPELVKAILDALALAS